MASTRGQFIELVFPGVWWSTWREPEPHWAAVAPGDGDFAVGEAGVVTDRVVAAQVQRAGDSVFGDVQGAGGVQEVLPDPVGGGGFVAGQLEREQPVGVPGDDGQGGVQVHVEWDAAGEGVEVESADVGVELVFDHHPLGVAGEQVFGGVARSWVISRVGSSRAMSLMAIWRTLALTALILIMSSCRRGLRPPCPPTNVQ